MARRCSSAIFCCRRGERGRYGFKASACSDRGVRCHAGGGRRNRPAAPRRFPRCRNPGAAGMLACARPGTTPAAARRCTEQTKLQRTLPPRGRTPRRGRTPHPGPAAALQCSVAAAEHFRRRGKFAPLVSGRVRPLTQAKRRPTSAASCAGLRPANSAAYSCQRSKPGGANSSSPAGSSARWSSISAPCATTAVAADCNRHRLRLARAQRMTVISSRWISSCSNSTASTASASRALRMPTG